MVLPIVGYGSPVLRQQAEEIEENYPDLDKLIADMFDTMREADGIGLAAPQIGRAVSLFVVDLSPLKDEDPSLADYKKVYINPRIVEEKGESISYNEGCLSVPDIHEDVERKDIVVIEYYNQDWELVEEELSGIRSRVVQHEYDHLEGVIFTDRVSALKKRLIKTRLGNITKGKIAARYRMKFGVKNKEIARG